MKITCTLFIGLFIALLGLLAGCSKTQPAPLSFSYQNITYVADSAYSTGSVAVPNSDIDAFRSPLILSFETTQQLVVGSYNLSAFNNSGHPFAAFLTPQLLYSQSGTLTVSYNDGKKMSGTFTITFTDGSVMTGSYTDIAIR